MDVRSALETVHHVDTTLMTAAVEFLGEEHVHQADGLLSADHASAQRQDVGIVVMPGKLHRVFLGSVDAADAGNAVGRQGNAKARAAHQNAPIRLAIGHSRAHGVTVHGIIAAFLGEGSVINHLMTQLPGMSHQHLPVFVPGVVAAECNFHKSSLLSRPRKGPILHFCFPACAAGRTFYYTRKQPPWKDCASAFFLAIFHQKRNYSFFIIHSPGAQLPQNPGFFVNFWNKSPYPPLTPYILCDIMLYCVRVDEILLSGVKPFKVLQKVHFRPKLIHNLTSRSNWHKATRQG